MMTIVLLFASFADAQAQQAEALSAAGIRTLESKHITLHTDLPSQPAVDELPKVFDLAIDQWATFFHVEPGMLDRWRVVACLMRDKQRFIDYRLLPRSLPPFLHGFQRVNQIWIHEQPSDYYRRHLLLHEGTHAVMNRIFGRVGPGWYREGMAELLSTHKFEDGKLLLGYFPKDKGKVKMWGRVKIIKDDIRNQKVRSIPEIVRTTDPAFLNVESYAWSWALLTFGHNHRKFAPLFQQLQKEMYLSTDGVTKQFRTSYFANKTELDAAWNLFLHHLDYGYDSSAEWIDRSLAQVPLGDDVVTARVDVTHGWQATGYVIPQNATINIIATGRFEVAEQPKPWISEPQGVTIEYYQRRPLGMLLAVIDDDPSGQGFTRPVAIGRAGKLTANRRGPLYLRINERADRMQDNYGHVDVQVKLVKE